MKHITEEQLAEIKLSIQAYEEGLCTLTGTIGDVLHFGFEVQSNHSNKWKLVKTIGKDEETNFDKVVVIDLEAMTEEVY